MTRPWSPVQVKQWSKHDSKKPRDQTREDEKLRGPSQKTAESCGIRSFIQSKEKLTTRAHMQIREGSRRLGKQNRAKEAAGWAEVGLGRSAQPISWPSRHPLWPSHQSGNLQPRGQKPRIKSFVIGRRGVEKRGTPSRKGEGRASWLGSP
jgi:hypothetical protein